jgi:hypothetical protein
MNRPLSVAHVGHVNAFDDQVRWQSIRDWLRENDPAYFARLNGEEEAGILEQHYVDLNGDPPRDFLAEQTLHDVVITHHLWGEMLSGYAIRTGGVAQSPLHSVAHWHRRLAETGARYVFLAGRGFNLATLGGQVPGYEHVVFLGAGFINVLRSLPSDPKSICHKGA